jgi:hypothetical protein
MKSLMENKQSNFHLKITQSEKTLFEKLQLEADDSMEELERKPRRYHQKSSTTQLEEAQSNGKV